MLCQKEVATRIVFFARNTIPRGKRVPYHICENLMMFRYLISQLLKYRFFECQDLYKRKTRC